MKNELELLLTMPRDLLLKAVKKLGDEEKGNQSRVLFRKPSDPKPYFEEHSALLRFQAYDKAFFKVDEAVSKPYYDDIGIEKVTRRDLRGVRGPAAASNLHAPVEDKLLFTFYMGLIRAVSIYLGQPGAHTELSVPAPDAVLPVAASGQKRLIGVAGDQTVRFVNNTIPTIESYLNAHDALVREKIAYTEQKMPERNLFLRLRERFDLGPYVALSMLGFARGLEEVAADPAIDEQRKSHVLALSADTVVKSGLAGTVYGASKLAELGDNRVMRYVMFPEALAGKVMEAARN